MFSANGLRVGWFSILLGFFAAVTANAAELQLGATAQYVYNSNFFSNGGNTDSANSFEVGPTVGIVDQDGRFQYNLTYAGGYQAYVDQSGVNAWESRLLGRATYDFNRRTSIIVRERFRDISNLRFTREDIALADNALDPRQNRYFRNDLEVELVRDLSRRLSLSGRVGHHWIDFDKNIDRSDSTAYDVGSELTYQLGSQHVVGVGASYTHQIFERALSRLGSNADYLNGYLLWNWQIADRIQFSMNGGPAWVRSDESDTDTVSQSQFVGGKVNGDVFRADIASCQGAGGSLASNCDFASFSPIAASDLGGNQSFSLTTGERVGEESVMTFFGGAVLQASFAEWNVVTSYSRAQNTTSGAGLASSLDIVFLSLEYAAPKNRWSAFVAGSWDRRETLTDATLVDYNVIGGVDGAAQRLTAFTTVTNGDIARENYIGIVGVRNALSRNWNGTLEFRYRRSEVDDPRASRPGSDTYLLLFTIDYGYDPIQF
jgi:hypothetical protein